MRAVQFGDAYTVRARYDQATRPKEVGEIEQKAQLYLTVGPFDDTKWFPPPAEGGTPVKDWVTLTDEDALLAGKQLGLDVSMSKPAADNQRAIDTFMASKDPVTSKDHGIGYIVGQLINTVQMTMMDLT